MEEDVLYVRSFPKLRFTTHSSQYSRQKTGFVSISQLSSLIVSGDGERCRDPVHQGGGHGDGELRLCRGEGGAVAQGNQGKLQEGRAVSPTVWTGGGGQVSVLLLTTGH